MDRPHANLVQKIREKIHNVIRSQLVIIDGESLDIASVIAVSKSISPSFETCVQFSLILDTNRRHGIPPKLNGSHALRNRIQESVSTLNRLLEEGQTIYGTHA